MKDDRITLQSGTHLRFPGMDCIIESCIGVGSNAIAYRGFYYDSQFRELKHQVVIKELFPFDPEKRIRREEDGQHLTIDKDAAALMQFHEESFQRGNNIHIRMLKVYPSELDANLNTYSLNHTLYSVLSFSGGRTLDSISGSTGFTMQSLKAKVLRTIEILDALDCFHQEGLLHLDISPDNILLMGNDSRERVSIIDYNSVHSLRELRDETYSCYLSQKAGFSSPEALAGRIKQIGFASDIYSVTSVFYWFLTGQKRTVLQILQGKLPGLSYINQDNKIQETVKSQIMLILKKGLAFSPRMRYQSILEMRLDLKELIDRIDGRGITQAAIWESGKSITNKLLNKNISLSFIKYKERRFPTVIEIANQDRKSLEEFSSWLLSEEGENCFIYGEAGIGKTSTLLTLSYIQPTKYTRERTAFIYLSLYDIKKTEKLNLTDQLLYKLRFKPEHSGMEEAYHELTHLLSEPFFNSSGKHPKLVLLLDGVNEYGGDPDELLAEIDRLSVNEGIRIVAAGRTFSEKLHLFPCRVSPLEENEVVQILQNHGLLIPKNTKLIEELHTPLLLSVYLQTMKNVETNINFETTNDLLGFYLKSILEKSVELYTENGTLYWQTRIAINYILPEIAFRMKQIGHSLSDAEMLSIIEKCYHRIGSYAFRKIFPECIGHSADILDGSSTAEMWYGILVHRILWNSLGLLVRDDNRKYRIFHQSMEKYLLTVRKQFGGKMERTIKARKMLGAGIGVTFASVAAFGIIHYMTPKTYDEQLAENVLGSSYSAYADNVNQYEAFNTFLDWTSKQTCNPNFLSSQDLDTEREKVQEYFDTSNIISQETAESMAENLIDTGSVMPWSHQPLTKEDYLSLEALPVECSEKYEELLDGLCYLMQDEENFTRAKTTKEACISSLREYLENDRNIADCYYYRIIDPELENFKQQDRDKYMVYTPYMQESDKHTVDSNLLATYQNNQAKLWRQLAYVWKERK